MTKGNLFVISGPSGSGKDTVLTKILKIMGAEAFLSVSMTTRKKREGEVEGIDYYFVTKEEFEANIVNDRMLEYAKYGDNYCGTPIGPLEKLLNEGKTVFLNIEVQGGANVRRRLPFVKEIFLMPPSLEEVERRLRKRGTETEEAIQSRLSIAKDEILKATEYDYIVVNDALDEAISDIMSIIKAESLKTDKMINKISEVINNA